MKRKTNDPSKQDTLSQKDIKKGLNTLEKTSKPHAALETADGKNNGAEPAVFENEQKAQP